MNYNFLKNKLVDDENLKKISSILDLLKDKDSDWDDGLNTFRGDPNTKKNKELGNVFFKKKILDLISKSIEENEEFNNFCFAREIEDILISKTESGGYYNTHTDIGYNGHFSTTIFLNDPDTYDGGELCLYIEGEERKIKLNAGHAITYPTGIPHRVNKVLSGTRIVAVFWTKSIFKDPMIREICSELCSINLGSDEEKIVKSYSDFESVISQNSFKLGNVINKLIRTYGDI